MGWVYGPAQGAWSGPLLWSGWLSSSSTTTPHRFITKYPTFKTERKVDNTIYKIYNFTLLFLTLKTFSLLEFSSPDEILSASFMHIDIKIKTKMELCRR